ncbi:unnamed protein product [Arctogadus glacialis]
MMVTLCIFPFSLIAAPIWLTVLLGITVLLVAVCTALIAVVYKCPKHRFSIWLKNLIPGNKQADGESEANNKKEEDHDKEEKPNQPNEVALLPSTSGPGDSELGNE